MARIAILTASDRGAAGTRTDESGDLIESTAISAGHEVTRRSLVPDDLSSLESTLSGWCDEGIADVVITTGGTGLGPRDVTPEATRRIGERDVPGIPIALAVEGLKHTPFAVLSRGIAVVRRRTLVVNLPGNPKAVNEGLDVLLPIIEHAARVLTGPLEHETAADSGHSS
ncbi:MAG: molybdenum cofactor biosynthesis protein B [Dehalococcoidia bacterium]